ncbi:MAG: HAD family hydrolase [Planctomycetes bacterium]|nr:HAD family hydrolase [Planctomycetota bacterium]
MKSEVPLPVPEAIVLDLDGVLADIYAGTALAATDDVAAIAALVPIAVVTSCPRRLAHAVLERHGYSPSIHAIVGGDDGPGKPSPRPVRLALERLGRPGRPAWMLGDNPSDVTAAKAAGVVALAVSPRGIGAETHAERLRAAGAARLVNGVAELRRMLES